LVPSWSMLEEKSLSSFKIAIRLDLGRLRTGLANDLDIENGESGFAKLASDSNVIGEFDNSARALTGMDVTADALLGLKT
jgi:hypothetical protein